MFGLRNLSLHYVPFFLTPVASALFCIDFLKLRENFPLLAKLCVAAIVLSLALIPVNFFAQQYAHTVATIVIGLWLPLAIVCAIVAWRNGAVVRLTDVADVYDGPEDIRRMGLFNGQRAVNVILSRQPGANIVATVDAVKAELPGLQAAFHTVPLTAVDWMVAVAVSSTLLLAMEAAKVLLRARDARLAA